MSNHLPLDSGDQYDKPLEAGQTYTVLLAHGPDGADNFTTQHEFVTMTQIVVWGLGLESATWGAVKESME